MKILKRLIIAILVLIIIALGYLYRNIADRHPGYTLNLNINPSMQPGIIQVGFGKIPITPEIIDTWNDMDGNAKYEPEKGDSYNDLNGNGKFDPVWIAGFHNRRPANGIHDDIWARVMVLDDGQTRMAIVGLDVVGFLHDDIVDIRKALSDELNIDYTIICSTHNHEGPDLVGIWGESIFKSGVDPKYMEFVKKQTVTAIARAVANMRQAKLNLLKI